ncbi:molecular chaperone [Endozoicomonas arenosclerae]|uniref:molecular chaperone n=1 Tax=Endozoicomonas arenosclerae TaxID=1633495 RepID=UPI00078092C5|nr:molecular chaperone [Endozoicomonas arenosclerae]
MALGFDYGTANCSVAHMVEGNVQPISLVGDDRYIPSTLSAPNRESVSEFLYRFMGISPAGKEGEALLRSSINTNRSEGIQLHADDVRFGHQATDLYLEDPTEVYYVKSPKSFLGLLGLREIQLAIFEDLVCAMMVNVKRQTEQVLQKDLSQVVIGRPVNFHNRGGEKSNRQAQGILHRAASRAGFKDIEFQYEPVAAGLEYESTLTRDQTVLVVDIGGGTTDCSMLKMGPSWFEKEDRTDSMIAHSGRFIGGNDLDMAIAFKRFMSEFGKDTNSQTGRPIPTENFWDPIAIKDVEAQRRFYAFNNLSDLKQTVARAESPEKVGRLLRVYQDTLGYRIIQEAENTKIALGEQPAYNAQIDLKTELLDIPVDAAQMEEAIATPLRGITSLIQDSIVQAGVKPDSVYITGGAARSPILRAAVAEVLPDIPIANGDFDGSVTSGLARYAEHCFK